MGKNMVKNMAWLSLTLNFALGSRAEASHQHLVGPAVALTLPAGQGL